jgi:hypothetical protein
MTREQVKRAFTACDTAFRRYIKEATETHRMLSVLSGVIPIEQRMAVVTQRSRENEAQMVYLETRNLLFAVLTTA